MKVTCPSCRCSFPVRLTAPNGMLTPKQRDLLQYIRTYIAENGGVAPTHDEMASAVGLASKGGVNRMIAVLEERGHIGRLPNRARAIWLKEGARA